jgi:hypothetical protein
MGGLLMKRIVSLTVVALFLIICLPSCEGPPEAPKDDTWRFYNKEHRHACQVNRLPYWDDIFKDCFPQQLGSKELDRLWLTSYVESVPIDYYDNNNKKFVTENATIPEQFTGYTMLLDYREPRSGGTMYEQLWPLELLMLVCEKDAKKWKRDCQNASKMKRYTVGDWTVYEGSAQLNQIDCKYAFFSDSICLLHQMKDKPYQVLNTELFDELLSFIDGERLTKLLLE